jgi:hypothetical protein
MKTNETYLGNLSRKTGGTSGDLVKKNKDFLKFTMQ